jgi:CRP-like cAMP-binding protein
MPKEGSQRSARPDGTVPAFSPSVDDETARLVGLPEPKHFAAGTILVTQGSPIQNAMLIRSGVVRLSFQGADGNEVVLGLRSQGWWVGGHSAYLEMPSLCSIQTLTDSALSLVPASNFSAMIRSDAGRLEHFLRAQCRELMTLQQQKIMQGGSAMERLQYLQAEATHSAWDTMEPSDVLRQGEIAKLLSITPEHLSRLKGRRRDGV